MLTENTNTNNNSPSSYHTETEKSNTLEIDIEQAKKQLKALGYSDQDTIYLRSFAAKHKTHFKDVKPKKYERTIANLPQTQSPGTGLYFVVNGGGHKDADVKQWRALFVEWDDLSIVEQFSAWKHKLPTPSIQVQTRRSVHTYWVFEEPVSVELGKQLQEDAIAFLKADPANKNPSRVLRLAGSWHIETMERGYELPTLKCSLEHCSGQRYSFEELRSLIPPKTEQQPPKKQKPTPPRPLPAQNSPLSGVPPLDIFLTKSDRELFMHGERDGSRNASGLKFAKNLIGTANRLEQLGIQFEGKPYDYFWGYCQRCDGKDWTPQEWDGIWKSAQKNNPTPSLTDDAIDKCLKAWQRKQGLQSQAAHLVSRGHQSVTNPPVTPDQKVETVLEHPEIQITEKTPHRETPNKPPTFRRESKTPYHKMNMVQKAFVDLFMVQGRTLWITIDDKLHEWNGKNYEPREDVDVERTIVDWLCCYEESTYDKDGNIIDTVIKRTKPCYVSEILQWAKKKTGKNPKEINPPGLNLANGILKIEFDKQTPQWELIPHDWNQYYTYCSEVEFNPDAPTEDCDRLLSALEPEQQSIFLKMVAASLDLKAIRELGAIGRIPAALCLGQGNNGKDSLRETVRLLYGNQGFAHCSLQDFRQYDKGTKFSIAQLINNVRISWSSENTQMISLDNLQSLKEAITGETMTSERKYKDGESYDCSSVFFFNLNELPLIQGNLEAIKSRYTILEFNKVFKKNANLEKGEIEADARFKDSKAFLKKNVLPAFLNRVLEALVKLMAEGIDPSATEEAFEEARKESNHLITFCEDMGLVEAKDAETPVKEIWNRLLWWYEYENGALSYVGERKVWEDQAHHCDKTIKAINQLTPRIEELFRTKRGRTKRGSFLKGITFDPKRCKIINTINTGQEGNTGSESDTDNTDHQHPINTPSTPLNSPSTPKGDGGDDEIQKDDDRVLMAQTSQSLVEEESSGKGVDGVDGLAENSKLVSQCKNYIESCENLDSYHEVKKSDIFPPDIRLAAWKQLAPATKSKIYGWMRERDIEDCRRDLAVCENIETYEAIATIMYKRDILTEARAKLTDEQRQKIDRICNPPAPPQLEETPARFKVGDRILYLYDRRAEEWGIGEVIEVSDENIKAIFPDYYSKPFNIDPERLVKEGDRVVYRYKIATVVSLAGKKPKIQTDDWLSAMPVDLEELRCAN